MNSSKYDDKIEKVMGCNVRKQLNIVVPDFFDNDYVVMHMQPKPESEQGSGYPFVQPLEPVIIASKHPDYQEGRIVQSVNDLEEMLSEGYNLTISPNKIRGHTIPSQEILEIEPCDSLVIAELDVSEEEFFGKNNIIYKHDAHYGGGREIYDLDLDIFSKAIGNGIIHFAFLPKKPGAKRERCYIDNGWQLKNKSHITSYCSP